MRPIVRFALTIIGALVVAALVTGFASTASAQPTESVGAEHVLASDSAPVQPEFTLIEIAQPIELCMMPGDTIELRAGIGAVIGFLGGLPIFIIGSIPGALIGAGLGALSHVIASWSARVQGGCTR